MSGPECFVLPKSYAEALAPSVTVGELGLDKVMRVDFS